MTGVTPLVLVNIGGPLVPLFAAADGFLANKTGQYLILFYDSNDCTGTPLVPAGTSTLTIAPAFVADDRHTAFYQSGPGATHTTLSELLYGVTDAGQCATFNGGSTTSFVVPGVGCCVADTPMASHSMPFVGGATQVDLNSLVFVPPFHVEGP